MHARSLIILVGIALIALLASSSLYTVDETQRGIKLRFGEIIETDIQPGLHWKLPLLNTVRLFDTRVQMLDASPSRYLTSEKKAVIVDSFVKWQIVDVTRFYEATSGNIQTAERLIAPRVDESLRNEFGKRELSEIISKNRDDLMTEPMAVLSDALRKALGIKLLDIRVKQVDLPSEVSNAVYDRMRSEREREAREYRAQGKESAEKIRAEVDRRRQVLLAEAHRDADILRGQGDAQAAAIYAKAYGQDEEFFSFMRSLQAYQESFNGQGDILVLDPESDFFKYLKAPEVSGSAR